MVKNVERCPPSGTQHCHADRLKLVLQLFFVEEMNLTEIAAVLEVSVPRVHQLRAKALKDLKALMEGGEDAA